MENTISDPASTNTIEGVVVRNAVPVNVIPASMFNPVAVKILQLFPMPSQAGLDTRLPAEQMAAIRKLVMAVNRRIRVLERTKTWC